jgi:hypothetical protein
MDTNAYSSTLFEKNLRNFLLLFQKLGTCSTKTCTNDRQIDRQKNEIFHFIVITCFGPLCSRPCSIYRLFKNNPMGLLTSCLQKVERLRKQVTILLDQSLPSMPAWVCKNGVPFSSRSTTLNLGTIHPSLLQNCDFINHIRLVLLFDSKF